LTSANVWPARPSLSIVWRKRQIEARSGVSASSGRPQKRRKDSRSRTASSAPGSESVRHCWRRTILNIVKGGQPGAPLAEAWIGASKASNAGQSNAFSIRSRKPPTFP
jgi:hypothetical protein